MKFLLSTICLLAGVVTSKAAPAETANQLKWTGQVKLGEPAVTIVGSAEEIYKEIIATNANYDGELGIYSNYSKVDVNTLGLIEKRAPTSNDFTCAYGNDVNAENVGLDVRYLYRIGNGECAAPPGRPGAGGCVNTVCAGDAGVWLCNDMNRELRIPCFLVADNAVEVLIHCQRTTYEGNNNWRSLTHGQIFSTDRSWNVILNRC